MDPVELVTLARSLIDIDSTTGREGDACHWVSSWLSARGYDVVEQPVTEDRLNVIATLDAPDVVLSTHIDTVPPFFPSRQDDGRLYGRGALRRGRASWQPRWPRWRHSVRRARVELDSSSWSARNAEARVRTWPTPERQAHGISSTGNQPTTDWALRRVASTAYV